MKCKKCGNEVSKENTFCEKCGTRIKKDKKVNRIILFSLISIFIVVIILVVVIKFINNKTVKPVVNTDKPNINTTIKIYGRKIEKDDYEDERLDIRDSSQISNDNEYELNDNEYELLGKYKCSNSDCSLKKQISKDFSTVLIKDGDYVIYNFKNKITKKTNLSDYDVSYLEDDENYDILCISSNIENDMTYYEVVSTYPDGEFINILIDPDLNVIFADSNSTFNDSKKSTKYVTYLSNGNVVYLRNNMINTYDLKTKKVSTNSEYQDTLMIANDYVMVVDNNYLKVLDLNGNEKTSLAKITDNMLFVGGYYEEESKTIYVTFEDSSVTCNDLSDALKEESGCKSNSVNLGYKYYYIPKTGESGKIATYITT